MTKPTCITVVLLFVMAVHHPLRGEVPRWIQEGEARPAWHYHLRECDLCVMVTAIRLHPEMTNTLVDPQGTKIGEYTPVDLDVDRILYGSPRMAFDGRFKSGPEGALEPSAKKHKTIRCLWRSLRLPEGQKDAQLIRMPLLLSEAGIYMLAKSCHRSSQPFVVTYVASPRLEGQVLREVDRLRTESKNGVRQTN